METSREVRYVTRLLRMSPLEEAEEILAAREAFLHPAAPIEAIAVGEAEAADARGAAVRRFEDLQQGFWKLDHRTLAQRIERLGSEPFPDLAAMAPRLREVARLRPAFHRLRRHSACFPEFLRALCRIVVATPRQAAKQRAAQLQAMRRYSVPHLGPHEYQRVARAVQSEFPELFSLEEEWLTEILTNRWAPGFSANQSNQLFAVVMLVTLAAGLVSTLLIAVLAFR